jgi:hypothetical protein
MRIEVGVGDLMQRIGDGQAQVDTIAPMFRYVICRFSNQLNMLNSRNQHFRNEIYTLIRFNHVMQISFHPPDTIAMIAPISCNCSNTRLQLH